MTFTKEGVYCPVVLPRRNILHEALKRINVGIRPVDPKEFSVRGPMQTLADAFSIRKFDWD